MLFGLESWNLRKRVCERKTVLGKGIVGMSGEIERGKGVRRIEGQTGRHEQLADRKKQTDWHKERRWRGTREVRKRERDREKGWVAEGERV